LPIPTELSDDYSFAPGQYLTLRTTMDGEEIRRSYSICSGPMTANCGSPSRRSMAARSRVAADELKPGDELDVMTPTGRFGVTHAPGQARIYVGFASGSAEQQPEVERLRRKEDGCRLARQHALLMIDRIGVMPEPAAKPT